jgi:hypothetical protein
LEGSIGFIASRFLSGKFSGTAHFLFLGPFSGAAGFLDAVGKPAPSRRVNRSFTRRSHLRSALFPNAKSKQLNFLLGKPAREVSGFRE